MGSSDRGEGGDETFVVVEDDAAVAVVERHPDGGVGRGGGAGAGGGGPGPGAGEVVRRVAVGVDLERVAGDRGRGAVDVDGEDVRGLAEPVSGDGRGEPGVGVAAVQGAAGGPGRGASSSSAGGGLPVGGVVGA